MVAEPIICNELTVTCIDDDQAFDALATSWDRLAEGNEYSPFCRWDWMRASWRHFRSDDSSLFILTVRDGDDQLIGLAPWYLSRSAWSGNVIRFLGSDQASSDYLSVVTLPQREQDVSRKLAEWLASDAAGKWDLIELEGVDATDLGIKHLVDELVLRGQTTHTRDGQSCWRLQLPGDWDEYLATFSRNRRQKIRSSIRKTFDAGIAELHRAEDVAGLQRGMEILIDLHQRRRLSLGDSGCFSDRNFEKFLTEVATNLHTLGMLRLQWIEMEGTPVAVDFSLSDANCIYGYQCGINPDFSKQRPGTLMMVSNLRRAIADGYGEFDFLRGDEDYKSSWTAECRPSLRIRIVPPRTLTRTKHGLWLTGRTIKQWIKQGRQRVRQVRSSGA